MSRDYWPEHDFNPKTDQKHWYKTSPHDDRGGSFNPFNMSWFSDKLGCGCLVILIWLLASAVLTVVGWFF